MKKRLLLSSIVMIVLCAVLFTGATFALFTSESKVNIAVTSGKVEVEATVEDITLYSMDVEQVEKFENGGTATVEGNQLVLSKVTPGDKAEILINIDNKSNVNTIWRFVWECADGYDLMSGMIVTINDTEYGAIKSYNSAWATLDADKKVKVAIELPKEAGNEYQNLETNVVFRVEVVQGNAGYTDAEKVTYIEKVAGQADLNAAIAEGAETVLLGDGVYTLPSNSNLDVEIVGNGETVINANQAQGLHGANLELTNVQVQGSTENYKGFQHTEKVVYNDCVIKDGMFLYGSEVEFNNCEFNLTSQYIWTYGAKEVTFNECKFYTDGKAILFYTEGSEEDKIVNVNACEFYATKAAYTWDGQHVAAIEIDGSLPNGGEGTFTLNVQGENVLDSEFNGLYRIKKDATPSNVTINDEASVKKVNVVLSTEELQNALDSAKKGDVIELAENVNYGVVYIGRPHKNNDTEMFCETHNYTTTNASEFVSHLAETGYHTTPQYTTTLEDLTIVGAEGATISGVLITSGHTYGDAYDYVIDKDYDSGSAYYCTLILNNLKFSNVNFVGKIDINTSDENSIYNGVEFEKCTFTTGGITSAEGAAIRYYNESNNGQVKNIVVKNSTFENCYQGAYIHNVNGITIVDCKFDTTGHNAIAIQSTDTPVDLKNVIITGNEFNNIKDRIIRFGQIGADSNITIQGNTASNSGDEDGEVMKAVSIENGISTSIKNNSWNGTVVDEQLKDVE